RALVGPEVYDADGQLVKSVLAQFLCRGREYSQQVDAIVHPRVAEAWHAFVEAHAHHTYIYMECAILFETGFDRWVDHTLAILCPLEVRIARIMARDHIDRATALRWIDLQMPDEQKAARATATLINDGQADVALQLHQLGLR
ncbi:MAG: dephospho-CoA kinase, partial [Bacteroidaceae bacterium]|nr:dephospho-CoA kinase [Bacteroidaceae bacterium]